MFHLLCLMTFIEIFFIRDFFFFLYVSSVKIHTKREIIEVEGTRWCKRKRWSIRFEKVSSGLMWGARPATRECCQAGVSREVEGKEKIG